MDSIFLALMSQTGKLFTLRIPSEAEGKYKFTDSEGFENLDFLSVQDIRGQWKLFVSDDARIIVEENSMLHSRTLVPKEIQYIAHENQIFSLYMEYEGMENRIFHNYFPMREGDFSIGNTASCDIYYPSPFIENISAVLSWRNGQWSIRDRAKQSDIFVNNRRIAETSLTVGDSIFLLGMRIVIGVGFISVNDGNLRLVMNPVSFCTKPSNPVEYTRINENSDGVVEFFSRRPRRKIPLENKEIIIEDPPVSLANGNIPLILRMGGSMVLGGSSLLHGSYASVLSMMLFPVLTQKYTDKQREEYEKKRVNKYRKYLAEKKEQILIEKAREEKILNQNYPNTNEILVFPQNGRRLFERRNIENDFLCIRIGSGEMPILAEYRYSEERFSLDDDPLESEMHYITDYKAVLSDVPVLLDLKENIVCSVSGHHSDRIKMLKNLILQISILNSYDEIKIVFLLDKEDLKELPEIRYLPHSWDDEKSFRYIATDPSEAYLIGEKLSREIEESISHPKELKHILRERPYFIIFALDKKIYDSLEILKTVFKLDRNIGLSVITFFSQIPKEAQALIRLRDEAEPKLISLKEDQMSARNFRLDPYEHSMACEALKTLFNIVLKKNDKEFSLPKMLTFLEMFHVGMVEHLNPYKRWTENNPVYSLAAPVGVNEDGSLFHLDLHEKYQGPHGLVAGSTGSGKSEFLITYILSMAVNYHPDEVQFLLIDYKGGGLAGAFVNPVKGIRLPHVAGTITNLDGSAINRSLSTIEAELNRRQRIFRDAAKENNEGTMDIYKYQKMHRKGILKEAMPHLFIIADEFAELKDQEPEFMDQLISAARIGRSLGIHLILATQKPSGVVNEQISANSKFRICFKVQTKSDSEEMLRKPDAAELKDTGRFYLSVGYNEFFAAGQSAWCGAPYEPDEEVVLNKDDSIQVIDHTGGNLVEVKPLKKRCITGLSQIVSVVQYLSDLAEKLQIKTEPLWLDPLPKEISVQNLLPCVSTKENELIAVLGMVDDPENQKQYPLLLNISEVKHMLVGGESRGGKTTFLETMLFSLCSRYSPERFQFYCIDLSGGALKIFDILPHCGGVFTENNEEEIDRFFYLLEELVEARKKLFAKADVNSFQAYNQIGSLPLITVLINQAANLKNWQSGYEHYMNLSNYMKEVNAYGICFVLTVNRLNDLLVKTQLEISHGYGILAKDKFDYQDIIGCKTSIQPKNTPGRGIFREGDRTLEFQTARFNVDGTELHRQQMLKKALLDLQCRYSNSINAVRIVSFSKNQTYEEFIRSIPDGRIPIGFNTEDMKKISMPLKQLFCTSIYLGNPDARETILHCMLQAYAMNYMDLIIVKSLNQSIFDSDKTNKLLGKYPGTVRMLASSEKDSVTLWKILVDEINQRKTVRDEGFRILGISADDPFAMTKCNSYMRENTRPLMVVFERYLDYCAEGDETCNHIMPKIFKEGKGYNFYFTAFFMEDDDYRISIDPTFKAFNSDGFCLLYGGKYDRQNLVKLPNKYAGITDQITQYGSLLMQYRESVYPLFMPCGPQHKIDEDPDDLPII